MTEWRPVPGWESLYEVSDHGQVRSLDRMMPNRWGGRTLKPGRVLKQTTHRGYLAVRIQDASTGRDKTRKVHQLVLEAFEGLRPEGLVGRHLDGNELNNIPSNLTWGTPSENNTDRVLHGTHSQASRLTCPQGHAYDYIDPKTGSRRCKTCRSVQMKAYYARKRQNND